MNHADYDVARFHLIERISVLLLYGKGEFVIGEEIMRAHNRFVIIMTREIQSVGSARTEFFFGVRKITNGSISGRRCLGNNATPGDTIVEIKAFSRVMIVIFHTTFIGAFIDSADAIFIYITDIVTR